MNKNVGYCINLGFGKYPVAYDKYNICNVLSNILSFIFCCSFTENIDEYDSDSTPDINNKSDSENE